VILARVTLKRLRPYLRNVSWADVPYAAQPGLTPYQVRAADGSETGLFTGYFEPHLKGSFTKTARYCYPVYAPPPDLSDVPHVTRGEVLRGALDNQRLELLYVDDAVDLFFAHVQGSAAVQLEDGSMHDKGGDRRPQKNSGSLCERSPHEINAASEHIIRIGFAAKSGHPYVAIGKALKDRGALQLPITMHHIKAWLRANPEQQEQVFASNPSFIFFKLMNGEGPIGASGEVLIPEQSLAVDDTIWPYGLSVVVATFDPVDNTKPWVRFMRTADKGSAIKGVIRGDIYFGSGAAAGARAGSMNASGKLWVLLPD